MIKKGGYYSAFCFSNYYGVVSCKRKASLSGEGLRDFFRKIICLSHEDVVSSQGASRMSALSTSIIKSCLSIS